MSGGLLQQKNFASRQDVLPKGWVDVAEYGAIGGSYTTFTAEEVSAAIDANNTAFTNALATGKCVYYDVGTLDNPLQYLLSATLTPIKGQRISPAAYFQSGATLGDVVNTYYPLKTAIAEIPQFKGALVFTGTTNYLFDLIYGGVTLENVSVLQHPSYVPTAGGHFSTGNTGTEIVYENDLRRCYSAGAFNGFYVKGKQEYLRLSWNVAAYAINAGFNINVPSPNGAIIWLHNRSVGGGIGLLVDGCDTSRLVGYYSHNCNVAMNLRANNYAIDQLTLVGFQLEDAQTAGNGIEIGNGAYPVRHCSLVGVEVYRGGATPINWLMGPNAKWNVISAAQIRGVHYTDAGVGNKLVDSFVGNMGYPTPAGVGATLSGTGCVISNVTFDECVTCINITGTRAKVIGNTLGTSGNTQTNGIVLAAGATGAIISLNDYANVTNPYTLDATAKASGRGVGNIGIGDW